MNLILKWGTVIAIPNELQKYKILIIYLSDIRDPSTIILSKISNGSTNTVYSNSHRGKNLKNGVTDET